MTHRLGEKHLHILGCALIVAALVMGGMCNAASPTVETEIVSFTPFGFQPRVITRQAGPVVLSLHNATRLPSLEFTLTDASGVVVQSAIQLGPIAKSSASRSALILTPGTYTLKIKELPAHTMQLVVK